MDTWNTLDPSVRWLLGVIAGAALLGVLKWTVGVLLSMGGKEDCGPTHASERPGIRLMKPSEHVKEQKAQQPPQESMQRRREVYGEFDPAKHWTPGFTPLRIIGGDVPRSGFKTPMPKCKAPRGDGEPTLPSAKPLETVKIDGYDIAWIQNGTFTTPNISNDITFAANTEGPPNITTWG